MPDPKDIDWYGTIAETTYANRGHIISFVSFYVGLRADFKASVTNYVDNYNCLWESDQPYGKSDPIMHFQGTEMYIQLSWDVHADSKEEAAENLRRASALSQMLYPVYENRGFTGASTNGLVELSSQSEGAAPDTDSETVKAQKKWCIAAPPLVTLKFSNIIQANTPEQVSHSKEAQSAIKKRFYKDTVIEGVIACIDQYSFTPDLAVGFFEVEGGILLPKKISLSCTLNVQHQLSPGLHQEGDTAVSMYEDTYGVGASNPTGADVSTSGTSFNVPTSAGGFGGILDPTDNNN